MNRVIVKIAGVEYPIVGEESIEYLNYLGEYVSNEVDEVTPKMPNATLVIRTTMAAINIADKMMRSSKGKMPTTPNEVILAKKLKEKESEIAELKASLKKAAAVEEKIVNKDFDELLEISNGFQNRIFELQEELELTKVKLEGLNKGNE